MHRSFSFICSSLLARTSPRIISSVRWLATTSSRATIMPSSKQNVTMLLLEGDEFFVDHQGVCRTYYELEQRKSQLGTKPSLSLEEVYDLKQARKTFWLRTKDLASYYGQNVSLLSKHAQGVVNVGKPHSRIDIQEIDQGVFGSAGTGATTWESSIAMSLMFSSQPDLLDGNVLELGSGVGLGGILISRAVPSLRSLTLTDGNVEVLQECRRNCRLSNLDKIVAVEELDWYAPPSNKKYDTILASDCAYRYPDVVSLARAMEACLAPEGRIHIFGPYNRPALHQLMMELRDELGMSVEVNGLEMNRYRLKSDFRDQESTYASRNVAQFLHITVKHPTSLHYHDTFQDID